MGNAKTFGSELITIAAFTTPADMITWLADQYGLQSHPTPKVSGGEMVPDCAGRGGEWHPYLYDKALHDHSARRG